MVGSENYRIFLGVIKSKKAVGKTAFGGERWVSNPRPTEPQSVALTN